jgi:UDP-N-acetyl-D-mannosaminuronic acid transferase (WecB/TagA/CpsF family)
MKITFPFLVLAVAAGLLTGCGESTSSSDGSSTQGSAAGGALDAAAKSAGDAVTDAAQAAQNAATDAAAAVKDAAKDAAAATTSQFQSLYDQAKQLVADGKGSEAVAKLTELTQKLKLTPEQQQMVSDLIAQAQKSLGGAADAAKKSLDGLLKK